MGPQLTTSVERDLRRLIGDDAVLPGTTRDYLVDETETRGVTGWANAICLPSTPAATEQIVAWCYEHELPIVPRGGGTGFSGGAVPINGGVVVALERLNQIRQFDPLLWRMHVDAGVTTERIRRLARETGLYFPPDPGAAEQSHIGGNIATNAGGPHAFKYGVTGAWVSGIEAVVAPGEIVRIGGSVRKDVAGYDLRSLLIGSEGTLGIITGAWLKLIPAPEAAFPSSRSTRTPFPARGRSRTSSATDSRSPRSSTSTMALLLRHATRSEASPAQPAS